MDKVCKNINKCRRGTNCSGYISCIDLNLCKLGKCKDENINFDKIVRHAFYPIEGIKKDPHQYRIQDKPYKDYMKKVGALKREILNAENFDEILEIVTFNSKNKYHEHIWGIGELTEYDIAFRIGRGLGKCPDKVYMHSGTREGAKKLKKGKIKGKTLSRDELKEYEYFDNVPICLIENFLCVCKDNPNEDSFRCYIRLYTNKKIC